MLLWNWMRGSVWGKLVLKKIEQLLNVKFLIKFGKNGAKINEMLSMVYSEDTLKPATVYKWVKRFQEGCENIDDDVYCGYPFSSCTEGNEYIPEGTIVKATFCIEVLKYLHKCIQQVQLILWKNKSWILHYDNAPAYSSISI